MSFLENLLHPDFSQDGTDLVNVVSSDDEIEAQKFLKLGHDAIKHREERAQARVEDKTKRPLDKRAESLPSFEDEIYDLKAAMDNKFIYAQIARKTCQRKSNISSTIRQLTYFLVERAKEYGNDDEDMRLALARRDGLTNLLLEVRENEDGLIRVHKFLAKAKNQQYAASTMVAKVSISSVSVEFS